jgi:hypothetical protein
MIKSTTKVNRRKSETSLKTYRNIQANLTFKRHLKIRETKTTRISSGGRLIIKVSEAKVLSPLKREVLETQRVSRKEDSKTRKVEINIVVVLQLKKLIRYTDSFNKC